MDVRIPTREDRIAKYFREEVELFTEAANDAIEWGSTQVDNKGFRYLPALFKSPINGGVEDELWDWLVAKYDAGGWILEKVWGEEHTPEYGYLLGINIFFKIKE